MRRLVLLVATAAITALALITALPADTSVKAQGTTCGSFPNQAAAQAAYRANPTGLRNLDADSDGIACESNPCPCDMVPVNLSGPQPTASPPPTATATPSSGPTEQVQLFRGCNNVASTYPNGTPASQVFANVSPAAALMSGWYFINAQQKFVGYSPQPGAPNDLTTINRGDPLFICVQAAATFTRPTI